MSIQTQPNLATTTDIIANPNDIVMGESKSGMINQVPDDVLTTRFNSLGILRVRTPIVTGGLVPLLAIELNEFKGYPSLFHCQDNTNKFMWDEKMVGNYFKKDVNFTENNLGLFVDRAGASSFEYLDPEGVPSRLGKCFVKAAADWEHMFTMNTSNIDSGTLFVCHLYDKPSDYISTIMDSTSSNIPTNIMIAGADQIDIAKARSFTVKSPFQHKQSMHDQYLRAVSQGRVPGLVEEARDFAGHTERGSNWLILAARNDIVTKDNAGIFSLNVDYRYTEFRFQDAIGPCATLTSLRPASAPAEGVWFEVDHKANLPPAADDINTIIDLRTLRPRVVMNKMDFVKLLLPFLRDVKVLDEHKLAIRRILTRMFQCVAASPAALR